MNHLDTIQALIRQGMTPLEAVREFDDREINRAAIDLMYDGDPLLFRFLCDASREEQNEKDMEQAIELWLAGWTSEPLTQSRRTIGVMSWYWRRPSKRSGKPGKLFLSTNQAHRAMKKEQPKL